MTLAEFADTGTPKMRNFFINSLEKIIAVILVLASIAVLIGAMGAMFSGEPGAFFAGIGILIFGAVYVMVMGGMLYLFIGIHDNTKRTADAVERMVAGG